MNFGQLISEIRCIEVNACRAHAKRDLTAGKAIIRGTVDEHNFMLALSWEKMVHDGWRLVHAEPGADRVLAVCRVKFGNAESGTLLRLRDHLSILLDREPAEVSAMPLQEFLAAWKSTHAPSELKPVNAVDVQPELEPRAAIQKKKGVGRPAKNQPRITINARIFQELSRDPEGDCWNWGLREWQQKLGCRTTSAISKTAAWKAVMKKRETDKDFQKSKARRRYDD